MVFDSGAAVDKKKRQHTKRKSKSNVADNSHAHP